MDKKKERRNFYFFGAGFVLVIVFAVFIPNPSPFQQMAFRWFASITGAGVGFNIPGFLSVDWRGRIGRNIDTTIKASGAIAIFVIIYLVNPPAILSPDTFTLTLRASSSSESNITRGKVRIQVGEYNKEEGFDTDGDATFKEIPQRYFGKELKALPDVMGYSQDPFVIKIDRTAITLKLELPQTHIEGQIILPPGIKASDVRIFADDKEGRVDENGRFNISLHVTGTVSLKVLVRNEIVYDRSHSIPGPVTIVLKRGT